MRRVVKPLVIVLVVAVAAVGGYVAFGRGKAAKRLTITAHFTAATGLYKGSSVRILGVPVGVITRIEPQGTSVLVQLDVPADQKIPADARAVIVPPSLVSDRYVQLAPVYRRGPTMQDGDDIPLDRTMTPVELDSILKSLDTLLSALGPHGANKKGALARLLEVGARNLEGNGAQVHTTISDLAQAVGTLSANKDDLVSVIRNLANFSETLANSDQTVRAFNSDLAAAAEQLAAERESLALALRNLSIALGEVASLIKDHRTTLGHDVRDLVAITDTVLANQRSLIEALDVTPLTLGNLAKAVNTDRKTLDIRQDNQQMDDPGFVLCSILQPYLPAPVPCPLTVTGSSARGPAPRVQPPVPSTPDLSLHALLGESR